MKVSDLIRMMDLPCIIVARLGLGTLNHTLLSVEHALRSGIKVCGVILNQTGVAEMKKDGKLACKTNPDVLKDLLRVPVLGVLKYRRSFSSGRFDPKELSSWIEKGLGSNNLTAFFSASTQPWAL
jgi:dethiobiotin synthetase